MKIYTGTCGGKKLDLLKKYDLGIMVSGDKLSSDFSSFPCAIDNGAFEAWRRGMPWSGDRFLSLLNKYWDSGITADFVVAPDIVAGGCDSLELSLSWFPRLRPAKIALAVQDGMTVQTIREIGGKYLRLIDVIFVGGTKEWKWSTAKEWVDFAHADGKKCHIARCGTLEKLRYAQKIGADSVDSTSFVRNESWHILEEFYKPAQQKLL